MTTGRDAGYFRPSDYENVKTGLTRFWIDTALPAWPARKTSRRIGKCESRNFPGFLPGPRMIGRHLTAQREWIGCRPGYVHGNRVESVFEHDQPRHLARQYADNCHPLRHQCLLVPMAVNPDTSALLTETGCDPAKEAEDGVCARDLSGRH